MPPIVAGIQSVYFLISSFVQSEANSILWVSMWPGRLMMVFYSVVVTWFLWAVCCVCNYWRGVWTGFLCFFLQSVSFWLHIGSCSIVWHTHGNYCYLLNKWPLKLCNVWEFLSVCMHTCVCRWSQRPGGGVGSLEAFVRCMMCVLGSEL